MKKLSALICGIAVGIMSIGSIVRADSEFPQADVLGVKDPRIADFIQNRVIKNEDRFIYDEELSDLLTRNFDVENDVYQEGRSFSDVKILHANDVNRLLCEGKDVRYNDAVLADWVFRELDGKLVRCEELTIAQSGLPTEYSAVLLSQEECGDTKWYVCDIVAMSRAKKAGEAGYRKFLFCSLKDYLDSYGDSFKGAVVVDRNYRYYRDGVGVLGGKNIFCWLSQEGHSATAVVDIFRSSPRVSLEFMFSPDRYEQDLYLFRVLREFAGLPNVFVDETILR